MKRPEILFVHATILLSLMFLASCDNGGSQLEGAWTCNVPAPCKGATLIFQEDGTGKMYRPHASEGRPFTWSVDGDQLMVHNAGEDQPIKAGYVLRDNTLVISWSHAEETVWVR